MATIRIGLAWTLYGAADLWMRATHSNIQWRWEWPYHVYSWLMVTAHDLQGDDPRGPWENTAR